MGKKPGSVVYVNFGSITVMTNDQLIEFAWGLASSKCDFLWVIRSDLVKGDTAVLPATFSAAIEGRGLLTSWCRQEAVLAHPAIAGFLTQWMEFDN
jgi:7-deoxyloganetin glucosyltransferase